jgi:Mlc titration factor MtfA (ptsG expression regulator)
MVYLLLAGITLVAFFYWKQQSDRQLATAQTLTFNDGVLEKHFAYYRTLTPAQKTEFNQRVADFLYEKEFISRGKLEITDEMKVLVAACAVQLTFGLSPVYLSHFDKIILYPDEYYSLVNRDYHVGEVNAGGIIVLSWKHFVEGYFYPNDSLNVGLHEMAHALLLENRRYGEDFLAPEHVKEFFQQAKHEYRKIQEGEESILRKYAGSNIAELFAVAVETFFENPKEMNAEAPQLYQSMKNLLNQNPLQQAA